MAPDPGPPPLERLPARHGVPVALAVALVSVLAVLVWAPWRESTRPRPTPETARSSASPTAGTSPRVTSSAAAPPPVVAGVGQYTSITDNEWTVVGLLTADRGPSTEEPATQHVELPAPSPAGPFVVLQQGAIAFDRPLERAGHPDLPCDPNAIPRERRAVQLPGGRVVYLGVTYPGMDPAAGVAARVIGRSLIPLVRASSVEVELAGHQPGWRYTIPTTGPGGTILFTMDPTTRLPDEAYRFEVDAPGVGVRYLYACIGG